MRKWILSLTAAVVVITVAGVIALINEEQALKTPTSEQLQGVFPGDSRHVLENSQRLTLYLLSPSPELQAQRKELFHDYPVLGKTQIADTKTRAKLLATFNDGMARAEVAAACFSPRHGIRAVQGGKSVDVVICFECLNFYVYAEGMKGSGMITNAPRATFDQVLSEAGIPVAK